MAVKKIQKNRMNDSGTFDVIHYETDASQVLMEDGTTAEAAISGKESAGAAAQALADAKSYTDTQIAGIPTPDVSGQINTHNTDASAHSGLFETKADLVDGKVPDSELPEYLVSAAGGGELAMASSIGAGPYTIEFTEEEDESIPASLISYDGTSSGVAAADVQGAIDEVWSAKADKPKAIPVTLTAAGWDSTDLTQTVTVSGVLADEAKQMIQPVPAMASQAAYIEAGILCTSQAADSLTFTAKAAPTEDLTVYVTIQEVAQG